MSKVLFVLCYFAFVTAANIFLKYSAIASSTIGFLVFQIAGNLSGFVGILAYTGLMRTTPLHIAFPVTQGVAILGIQLIGSLLVFREAYSVTQVIGTVCVAIGIVLVGAVAPADTKAPEKAP